MLTFQHNTFDICPSDDTELLGAPSYVRNMNATCLVNGAPVTFLGKPLIEYRGLRQSIPAHSHSFDAAQ